MKNKGKLCWILVTIMVFVSGNTVFAEDSRNYEVSNNPATQREQDKTIQVASEDNDYKLPEFVESSINDTELVEIPETTVGSTTYNPALDEQNVQLIGFVANDSCIGQYFINNEYDGLDVYIPQDSVLYIKDRHINDINEEDYMLVSVEGSNSTYYVNESEVTYVDPGSNYNRLNTYYGGTTNNSYHNGWRVTYYGPEPYANGGNTRLANGDSPYNWIGQGVAVSKSSGIALGTVIDVPGHGPMTVVDYGAPKGVIDVLVGSEREANSH